MKNTFAGAALAAALMSGASGAHAAGSPPPVDPTTPLASAFTAPTTIYSSRAAFNAAVTNGVTDTFEGVAGPTSGGIGVVTYPGAYTDANSTTFTTSGVGNALSILDATYVNGSNIVGTKFGSDVLTSQYGPLTINFASPTTSFAIDFAAQAIAFANKSDTFSFTVNNGVGTQTQGSAFSGLSFFGFTSSTAFTSVTIDASASSNRFFDNVTSAAAPAVSAAPEPGTWALMLGGIAVMGAAMRLANARRREEDLLTLEAG